MLELAAHSGGIASLAMSTSWAVAETTNQETEPSAGAQSWEALLIASVSDQGEVCAHSCKLTSGGEEENAEEAERFEAHEKARVNLAKSCGKLTLLRLSEPPSFAIVCDEGGNTWAVSLHGEGMRGDASVPLEQPHAANGKAPGGTHFFTYLPHRCAGSPYSTQEEVPYAVLLWWHGVTQVACYDLERAFREEQGKSPMRLWHVSSPPSSSATNSSRTEQLLATGHKDGSVLVWSSKRTLVPSRIAMCNDEVTSLAWKSDASFSPQTAGWLIAGTRSEGIHLIDYQSRAQTRAAGLRIPESVRSIDLFECGLALLLLSDLSVLIYSLDHNHVCGAVEASGRRVIESPTTGQPLWFSDGLSNAAFCCVQSLEHESSSGTGLAKVPADSSVYALAWGSAEERRARPTSPMLERMLQAGEGSRRGDDDDTRSKKETEAQSQRTRTHANEERTHILRSQASHSHVESHMDEGGMDFFQRNLPNILGWQATKQLRRRLQEMEDHIPNQLVTARARREEHSSS